MNLTEKVFAASTFIFAFLSCSKSEADAKQADQKPNIIYILADDMGIHDAGCYGQQQIKTPFIDKMAEEGMRFTQHYAGSTVCAPSRCTLMTGLHTGHAYIKGNFAMKSEGNLPIPSETVTVAEILKSNGYTTGIFGKWGLGGPDDNGHPNLQGFDYSLCYLDQRLAHEYYPDHLWRNFEKVSLNNQYSHDLFTNGALKFVRENKNKPFFLYIPYTIPHGKYQVPDNSEYADQSWSETNKNYAAMISRMDADIGKLFTLLDSLNLDENTVVFFTSDNGATGEPGHFFHSNDPFRGYKTDLYEGGIREPLVVRWPGKIAAGSVSSHVSAFWDFLPTVCDLIGVQPPSNSDGISFLPALLNQSQKEHEFMYWEYFNYNYNWKPGATFPRNYLLSQAVRMGDWKAVRNNLNKNPDAQVELYNLADDISEQHNVAEENPDVVQKIMTILEREHKDTEFFKK